VSLTPEDLAAIARAERRAVRNRRRAALRTLIAHVAASYVLLLLGALIDPIWRSDVARERVISLLGAPLVVPLILPLLTLALVFSPVERPSFAWVVGGWAIYIAAFRLTNWLVGRQSAQAERRLRAGHCPACGYDLRATPGRCPECGRVAREESAG
jgi:hypothetical protein